ncbi:MAG: hypothetical protein OK455_01075 [Thaumarchaeota archaeon]|nr:hypothetical protein [Nitrososphaerota archaeon]
MSRASGDAQPTDDVGRFKDTAPVLTGRVRWFALVTLLLLAACLAEFLTGSTPILVAFTHPAGFAVLVGLYGGGALLIRETTIRWGKRWGTVLLLGGAYAVGEEGFGAKTMVDPTGSNIGNQLYSHWAGVNWVPLAELTLFHAAFSIAVPLLLVESLFPETRGKRLLRNRWVVVTILVYGLAVYLVSFGDPFKPPLAVTAFLAAYASMFITAAYLIPRSFLRAKTEAPDRRELRFLLLGIGFMGGFFLIFTIGAHLLPWPVTAALFIPLAGLTAYYLTKHAGRSGNDLVKIDFLLGVTLVFVPIDISLEFRGDIGVLLFTALILALMFGIRRRKVRLDAPSNALSVIQAASG